MQSHAQRSGTQWTMTHAFFANMGGYILHFDTDKTPTSEPARYHYRCGCDITTPKVLDEEPADSPCRRCRHWDYGKPELSSEFSSAVPLELSSESLSEQHVRHGNYCCCSKASQPGSSHMDQSPSILSNILGFFSSNQHRWREEPWDDWYDDDQRRFKLPIAINSAQLCVFLSKGLIAELPHISEEDIKDKSKEDMLVKSIALGQVIWLIVEQVARKVSGLPSTQLEIAVLSFSVCAIVIYSLLLNKPKDVMGHTKIFITRQLDDSDKDQLLWLQYGSLCGVSIFYNNYAAPKQTIRNGAWCVEASLLEENIPASEMIGFGLGAAIFSVLHCLAWNLVFPTTEARAYNCVKIEKLNF
ncbi:hypothetical protein F4819DRAFT_505637 [Hypoxylon fuscum]|nr:hypothetical protein F4819DRAFT_505637 [Hypoxylon fuscum]